MALIETNYFSDVLGMQTKMNVIKAVKDILGLGLKESKELVDAAPKTIKAGISKEEADEIVAKLKEAGATTEVK